MNGEAAQGKASEASEIHLSDDYDVLYWAARLYCTASQLRVAVAAVGPREADVRMYLHGLSH